MVRQVCVALGGPGVLVPQHLADHGQQDPVAFRWVRWRGSRPTSLDSNSRAAAICGHVPSLHQRSYHRQHHAMGSTFNQP